MNRKSIFILVTILISFCFVGLSIAEEKKGNARKGKYLFRKNCRACHRDGGKAQPMGPYDKKVNEWKGLFAKDKHKEYKCKDEWEKLSEQDLCDILKYLIDGAVDSPVPRGCG